MSRILIEVEDQVAQAFMQASVEQKKLLSELANLILKKNINYATWGNYKQLLDGISKEAEANGLTPEILNQLLDKND